MNAKINKVIAKLPNTIIYVIIIIENIVCGLLQSKINLTESSITQGFTWETFRVLLLCYSTIILCSLIDKVFSKTYSNNLNNINYIKYLDRALSSKMSDIQTVSTGKIFDATKDLSALQRDIRLNIIYIIPTLFPLVTLLYKETLMDWRMTAISIASLIIAVVMTLMSDRLFKWNTEAKRKKANLQGITVDNFMNIKTIKYLGKAAYAKERHIKAQREARDYFVNPLQILWFRIIDAIGIAPILINILISKNNTEMIAMILLSSYTLNNMRYYATAIAELFIEKKAQESIISNLKGDDTDEVETIEADKELKISNVMFDYGEDSEKFYIDNLTFEKDTRTLVYGESGEGKSSLANLIAGGVQPTTGSIPRYKTYYIWQETESLDDTLWNNIVFDNPEGISEDEVLELFKELNMIDWFSKLKDGFNTQIGERGCRLSSGQKQRLNIIRLVLTMKYHPEMIFIIDERTSNLDSVTRKLAIDLIDKMCNSTLICISHNEGFDKICEHHVLVKDHRFNVIK